MPVLVSADTGAREYNAYRAHVSWEDPDGYYAAHNAPVWKWYLRRYLKVEAGRLYLLLFISDCVDPWWYMVPVDAHIEVLARGGWSPPCAFVATPYGCII